jgi:AAA domain/UvrD-like helicase C-terminal domain
VSKPILSENQDEGYDLALRWYESGGSDPFVLKGFSGTGKSFLAAQICLELIICYPEIKIALCAPTHKAKHVLATFATKSGLDSVWVSTLHSLLHVLPGHHDDAGRQGLAGNQFSQEPSYLDFDLVIIDEASMIGVELLSWIPSQRVPTLFMGDPAQLPPVEDDGKESPVFTLPCGIELTEVMRYDGAIAEIATRIRQQINGQFLPRISSGGNLTKLQPDQWMDKLIESVYISLENEDVNYARAMAWTNRRVNELNQAIRAEVFGNLAQESFFPGERLMAKELIIKRTDQKAEILLYSCADCTVSKSVYHCVELNGTVLDGHNLALVSSEGEINLNVLDHCSKDWLVAQKYFADWRQDILDLPQNERRYGWRDFYAKMEELNVCWKNGLMQRLQPALAITIHQAQGSTFKNAFVDLANVYGCREPKTRNQLTYVAFTRASEQLYVRSKY